METKWILRVVLVNIVLLGAIFYNAPLKLAGRGAGWEAPWSPADKEGVQKLLEIEQQKGSTQINGSVTGGNDWFRFKFTLMGGLIAGFLWKLGFDEKQNGSAEERLAKLVKSNATATVLALATALALMIDMQNRQTDCINKQIGLWMAHYMEPAMFGLDAAPAAVTNPGAEGAGTEFLAWEQFLRVPGAMHTDVLHASLLSLFGNFATWGIFLLYLSFFARRPVDPEQRRIQRAGFWIVHLLLLSFAVVAHTAPAVFTLVLPGGGEVPAQYAWVCFVAFALALTAFNWWWPRRLPPVRHAD